MTTENFIEELKDNLTRNILPYWLDKMLDPKGGFYGCRDGNDLLIPEAPRGAVLNARLLWTFSTVSRLFKNKEYAAAAKHAFDYFKEHFIDKVNGGVYWSVNADGTPLDTRKQFYALGFAIYGLSEYARATGSSEAAQLAVEIYNCIETYSRDKINGGYIEALTADWKPIADMRLSEKDENVSKSMNTHLHILEPYTNLYRLNPDIPGLAASIRHLLNIFTRHIENKQSHHLGLFFDNDWRCTSATISYGHDIEASWLLLEAALELADRELIANIKDHAADIAHAALEGRSFDGSMVYERFANGHYDNDKHWWVQAENVIGQLYLWKYHGEHAALSRAMQSWEYIRDNIVDPAGGEWYWSVKENGVNTLDCKAGFWKCPYHNTRMCIESLSLLGHSFQGADSKQKSA